MACNIDTLREDTASDQLASKEVQTRIDALRNELSTFHEMRSVNVLFDVDEALESARKVSKDTTRWTEAIYDNGELSPIDRTMLQTLIARQVASDKLVQQYAELSALQSEACGHPVKDAETEEREFLEAGRELDPGERACGFGGLSASKEKAEVVSEPPGLWELLRTPLSYTPKPANQDPEPATVPAESHGKDAEPQEAREADSSAEEDADEEEQEEEEEGPDESSWPLLYRILSLNPATDPAHYNADILKAHRKLSLQHDPKRLPNDPDAPARWAAITKAYDTLRNPEKKKFYDLHGRVPAELEDFDLSTLRINEE